MSSKIFNDSQLSDSCPLGNLLHLLKKKETVLLSLMFLPYIDSTVFDLCPAASLVILSRGNNISFISYL